MEFTVQPDVTHRTSWRESTGEYSGRPKAFSQHCAPKEANVTLVRTKQGSTLLPNVCIKGEIKQTVLLISKVFTSINIHVAMATDALTCGYKNRCLQPHESVITAGEHTSMQVPDKRKDSEHMEQQLGQGFFHSYKV